MNESRMAGYLGLTRRAGAFSLGEVALQKAKSGKGKLLIVAADAAANTLSDVEKVILVSRVPTITFGDKTSLGLLFGKGQVAVIAITNQQLAKQIIKSWQEEQHEQQQETI